MVFRFDSKMSQEQTRPLFSIFNDEIVMEVKMGIVGEAA
jgi:hypothetical protein